MTVKFPNIHIPQIALLQLQYTFNTVLSVLYISNWSVHLYSHRLTVLVNSKVYYIVP